MPGTQRDLYEVLGVPRDATADQIKHAYRAKVRECHPDTHPNDPDAEQKYKEVNAAFSVLGDQEKRARYDQFGTTDDMPGGNPFGGMGAEDIFGDLFGSMLKVRSTNFTCLTFLSRKNCSSRNTRSSERKRTVLSTEERQ